MKDYPSHGNSKNAVVVVGGSGADPGFCARGVLNFARVSARAKFGFLKYSTRASPPIYTSYLFVRVLRNHSQWIQLGAV